MTGVQTCALPISNIAVAKIIKSPSVVRAIAYGSPRVARAKVAHKKRTVRPIIASEQKALEAERLPGLTGKMRKNLEVNAKKQKPLPKWMEAIAIGLSLDRDSFSPNDFPDGLKKTLTIYTKWSQRGAIPIFVKVAGTRAPTMFTFNMDIIGVLVDMDVDILEDIMKYPYK